jgi:ribosomal protein S18 acetylase RimI-like enzyme
MEFNRLRPGCCRVGALASIEATIHLFQKILKSAGFRSNPSFSMSSYQVRPATVRDAKTIAQIHVASAQAAYQGLLPDDQLPAPSVEKRQAYWREAIEYSEPQVQVVTKGDEIVGFVGFDRSRDKGTPSTMGEIWSLYVLPAECGQGAGVALWDAANDGLKEEGCTNVSVWVPVRNERAMRFFEHAGFKREMTSLKTVPVGIARLEEIRLKRPLG